MGLLQATYVTPGRIRALVQVNAFHAETSYVLPAAALQWIHIVMGASLDSIGFNKFFHEFQYVADEATVDLLKGVIDSVATVDETTYVLFKKGNLEALHTSEVRTFGMAKSLADNVAVTDDFYGTANTDDDETMVFSKAVPAELQTVSDSAHSSVGKRLTDAISKSDVQHTEFGKGLTEAKTTSEAHHFDIEKQLNDVVDAGDEFNAVALTDDGEVMVFGKTLADEWTYSDSVSVQPEKVFEDTVEHPTDQIDFIEVGKGIEDVPVTSELMVFGTAKLLENSFEASEQLSFAVGLAPISYAHQGEGPNFYDTYAVGYFAETYCLEGFPALDFHKGILDTVHATDDFFGVANTDDDETMAFGKTLSEVFHYGDSTVVTFFKAVLDLASTADAQTITVAKSLTDQVNKTDLAIKANSKTLADSSTTSDAATRSTGKSLSDSANTAEYNSFVIQKSLSDTVQTTDDFLGNANADDDETMLFGKTISDSFTKSDLTVKTAGKGLADTASTSESGSIVWTDYWPIGYTDTSSSVYVGTRRTF